MESERGRPGPGRAGQSIEGTSARLPPVVTIASLYGVGGDVVGPKAARQLGVEYLDRAIPSRVAHRVGLPREVVAVVEERPRSRGQRLLSALARAPSLTGGPASDGWDRQEQQLREEINAFLARATTAGGVVLGRAGAVVLATVPGALHVHLGGPLAARVSRAMDNESIDQETAARRVDANDHARRRYVQDAYGVDGDDPSLYHLMLDGTAFTLDSCVSLIVEASNRRTGAIEPAPQS